MLLILLLWYQFLCCYSPRNFVSLANPPCSEWFIAGYVWPQCLCISILWHWTCSIQKNHLIFMLWKVRALMRIDRLILLPASRTRLKSFPTIRCSWHCVRYSLSLKKLVPYHKFIMFQSILHTCYMFVESIDSCIFYSAPGAIIYGQTRFTLLLTHYSYGKGRE